MNMNGWVQAVGVVLGAVLIAHQAKQLYDQYTSPKETSRTKTKRELKHEKRQARKMYRRQQIDIRVRQKRIAKAKERDESIEVMTEEERKTFYLARKQKKVEQQEKLALAQAHGMRVVVDLAFTKDQTERECYSLIKQIACCYGYMKKFPHPGVSLQLASYTGDITSGFNKQGIDSWKINCHEQDVQHAFPNDRIVYLSPDSPNFLEAVDKECVYVVGGIVDRSVRKDQSSSRARDINISTARLPIQEYTDCRTHILNVDTVTQILLEYTATPDWNFVLTKHLPKRMLNKKKSN